MSIINRITNVIHLLEVLRSSGELENKIELSIQIIFQAISQEKPVLVCGNGGSASDAEHITGELVGRFLKERKAIHAISLVSNTAAITAWANDYNYETVFSRQVEAHGKQGGVLWAISTSGNSNNVIHAIQKAKELGLSIIGMTGESGGKMASLCDVLLNVPSKETPRIQEMHIILYHYICEELERRYLENGN